jgi:hypothetical protein
MPHGAFSQKRGREREQEKKNRGKIRKEIRGRVPGRGSIGSRRRSAARWPEREREREEERERKREKQRERESERKREREREREKELNTSELLLLLLLYTHELKHRFSRAAKGLGNSFPHGSWDLISQHFDRSMQPIPSRVFTSILVLFFIRMYFI